MVHLGKLAVVVLALLTLATVAAAAEQPPPSQGGVSTSTVDKSLAILGICVGAALVVFSGAKNIATIGSNAVQSIARQPEAAGSMFLSWLLTAAMIEGAMLFGLVICYMTIALVKTF